MSIPPIPSRADQEDGGNLLMEVIPALARITVELPREHQRLVTFHPFCPARIELEKIVGQELVRAVSKTERKHFLRLAKLAAYALELADEVHQLDGKAALDFASGFVAGEKSSHDPLGGPEIEEQALAAALEQSFLRASQASPFVHGFQTRRDQRRTAAADGKDSA